MGTRLTCDYTAIVDDATASPALFYPVGDVCDELTIAQTRDRTENFPVNINGRTIDTNGVVLTPSLPHRAVLGFDLPYFESPWLIALVGQGGYIIPIQTPEQEVTFGVDGSPMPVAPTIEVRGAAGDAGPQAYTSPYIRIVRFETGAGEAVTQIKNPSLTPPEGTAITLDPTLPIAVAAYTPAGQAADGNNAFVLPDGSGAEKAAQTYPYFTGFRLVSVAPGDRADGLNGGIAKKAGAPALTHAVTVIAAYNCRVVGEELD